MTTDFKYLTDDSKLLIERHIKEREQLAAQGAAQAQAGAEGTTAMMAAGTPPPLPGPIAPVDAADVTQLFK